MTPEEIEKTYKEAMEGSGTPNYVLIRCDKCGRSFELIAGRENEVCSHLMERINDPSKKMAT